MLDRLTIERMAADEAPIVVALSGGGDSTALLHLLVEAIGAARLRAGVVDHGLRAGSDEDARRAAQFAQTLGVQADVLSARWRNEAKPAQGAARAARYRALAAFARETSARVIALAHTADDQAETVAMRAAAGSHWRGLAGIAPLAPLPLWPEGRGLLAVRPLLNTRRAALRGALRARSADWIEDPANVNTAFERVRVRQRLLALEAAGLDPMRLVGLAGRLRLRVEGVDAAARALIAGAVDLDGVSIRRADWDGPRVVRARALAALAAAVAGAERVSAEAEVAELEQRMLAPTYRGGSFGGVVFRPTEAGVSLARDPGAVLGRADGAVALAPLALELGVESVWDGRLAFVARAPGCVVVPAKAAGFYAIERDDRRLTAVEAAEAAEVRPLIAEHVRHLLGAET